MVVLTENKKEFYQGLLEQTEALISGESDIIANMANISALLFEKLNNVNWVGFYRLIEKELVLGPFQGKVACIRIPLAKGVCGTSAETGNIQRVSDVHMFDGHIACDVSTNAEIVLPLKQSGEVFAVLDIDSESFNRFDDEDELGLASIVSLFELHVTKYSEI